MRSAGPRILVGLTTIVRIPRAHDNRRDIEAMRQAWDSRAETNLLYSIDAQNRHWAVEDFYARGPALVAEFVDPVLGALGVDPAGLRVLEIGCGIGRLFAGLAERFGEVWGTDISHSMIDYGQVHCPVSAIWLVGDGTSLHGIDDSSVDHVLSYEVFGHIQDLEVIHGYLAETSRVLRPGGTFQVQLRWRSDSVRQATVRFLPRRLRRAVGRLLQRGRIVPVEGDIDTWLGRLVPPKASLAFVHELGFVDVATFPSDPERSGRRVRGYWLAGRRPA